MSHVLAADYRVATSGRGWDEVRVGADRLAGLGARSLVVYRAAQDPRRVFMVIGLDGRESLDKVFRSGVAMGWFDAAGVDDIPPIFAGDVLERIDLVPDDGEPADIVIAAIAPVLDVALLVEVLHNAEETMRDHGIRRVWIYRALDDGHEVMILQEVDSLDDAHRWMRRPRAAADWMEGAGLGVYPPPFVGTLVEVVRAPEAD